MIPIPTKVFFLMLSLTLMIGSSKGYKTHLQQIGLKGKVKEVVISTYKIETNSGEIVKDERVDYRFSYGQFDMITGEGNSKFIYNEDGSMMEGEVYNRDGELEYKIIYSYDDDGYLIERRLNNYVINNSYQWKLKNHTDKNPYLSESEQTYDSKGKLIITEERVFDNSGKTIELRTTFIESDSDNIIRITKMEYDSNNNLVREEKISENSIIEYSYNDKGLLENVDNYDSEMRKKGYGNKMYKYNENGDIIEVETDFVKNKYEYEYDEKGNWIRRTQTYSYSKGDSSFLKEWNPVLTERNIEYFE